MFLQLKKSKYTLSASGEFKFFSKHKKNLDELKKNITNFINYKKMSHLYKILKLSLVLNFKFIEMIFAYFFFKKIKAYYDFGISFYIQSEQIPIKNSCIKFNKSKKILL